MSPATIAALFILKVFAGVVIGWIMQKFYPGNDYWAMNHFGIEEYKLMRSNPHEFFTNIFKSPYDNGYSGFFNSIGSYWNDLRYNIILKLLAFCDIFSRGNYYINSLIFNFFGFFGPVALFRVFAHIYKNKKWAVIAGCFLLPSTLFYASGIHKDLIIFTMLGLFCYALYFSAVERWSIKRSILIFLSVTVMLLIRNYVAIALIPPCVAFVISTKRKMSPVFIFIAIYAVIIVMLFVLELAVPSFQPLKVITQKQTDFLNLPLAGSQIDLNVLEPNLKSFLINLPQAFNNGVLRPYLWDSNKIYLLAHAIELLLYEVLFLLMISRYRKKLNARVPFILMALFFSISMLLITGFIIPNIGSIVRYKSIYLPFLLTPLLASIYPTRLMK